MSSIDDFPAYKEKVKVMFDALSRPNHITDAHKKALEHQNLFNELDGTDEEKSDLANHIIRELDDTCNHVKQTITVTGKAHKYSFDLGAIDFDNGILSEYAIERMDLEDVHMQSLGYIATARDDAPDKQLVIYHVASMGIQEVMSVPNASTIYRQDAIFIPIDGTAEVTPVNSSQEAHVPFIEYYIPDLLNDVERAILNTTSATYALRSLAKIDLTNYSEVLDYDDLSSELTKYMNGLMPLYSVVPCAISGINSLLSYNNDINALTPIEVDPEFIMTGHIYELDFMPQVIGEEQTTTPQFCLTALLPLNDGEQLTLETVHIPLSESIIVDIYPVLKTKPLQS